MRYPPSLNRNITTAPLYKFKRPSNEVFVRILFLIATRFSFCNNGTIQFTFLLVARFKPIIDTSDAVFIVIIISCFSLLKVRCLKGTRG